MTKSFESMSLESVDVDRMHLRAGKILDQDRVDENDFIEPYGQATIDADLAEVERLESLFNARDTRESKEQKKVADIFEAIVLWNGEQSNWLGENAVTVKTSRYDDYVNGVDAVIEFQGNEPRMASYLGIAADVTFSTDTTKKFDRLKNQIDKGELAKVKYFHSEHMNIHGQLSKLPAVILGMDKSTVLELAELQAEKKFKELGSHRAQIMMLEQMRAQFTTYSKYADRIGKQDLGDIYRDRLKIVEGLLEEKSDLANKVKYEINDEVHSSIMSFMKRWEMSMLLESEK